MHSKAATLDVDAAFRCCPITPSQQRNFIIHWNGYYYIDHNAPFGATSTGGVFGRVADVKSAILKSEGLGPSKKLGKMTSFTSDFLFQSPQILFPFPMPWMIFIISQHALDGCGRNPKQDHSPLNLNTWASHGIYMTK